MRKSPTAIIATLVIALTLPLAACGSSSNGSSADTMAPEQGYYDEVGSGYASTGEYAYSEEKATEADYETAEAEVAAPAGLALDLTSPSVPAATDTQKLVYSANVSIDTTDYDASVAALRELMANCGAFAEYENEWQFGGYDSHALELTIRVPAESYETLMAGIDGIGGTVTSRTSQVTNITRTYNDNEAIIAGLEVQEQRLLEMMSQAESVDDMLLVEERLSEVQTQLNRARTSRASMDSDVSLSTVTVCIYEVRHETTPGRVSYGTRVGNAFVNMWQGFVEGVGDFFIDVIYAIPAIVIVAVAAVLGTKGVRRIRRRRAARKSAGQPPAAPAVPVDPEPPADVTDTTE